MVLIFHPPVDIVPGCLIIKHDHLSINELDISSERLEATLPSSDFEHQLYQQLDDYFSAPVEHNMFSVRLSLQGTMFQQRVWQRLTMIPLGHTVQYGELARELDSSAQAVGNACRSNPVALLVPCHRVVAKTGIGGFAGHTRGEYISQKSRLLLHEGVML